MLTVYGSGLDPGLGIGEQNGLVRTFRPDGFRVHQLPYNGVIWIEPLEEDVENWWAWALWRRDVDRSASSKLPCREEL